MWLRLIRAQQALVNLKSFVVEDAKDDAADVFVFFQETAYLPHGHGGGLVLGVAVYPSADAGKGDGCEIVVRRQLQACPIAGSE